VPARAGPLHVPGPRLAWWDAAAGIARTASLPDLRWQVVPGGDGQSMDAPVIGAGSGGAPDTVGTARWWPWLAGVFAMLWLVTLAWALRHRKAAPWQPAAGTRQPEDAVVPATLSSRQWRQLFQAGDLADIAAALCAAATPPA